MISKRKPYIHLSGTTNSSCTLLSIHPEYNRLPTTIEQNNHDSNRSGTLSHGQTQIQLHRDQQGIAMIEVGDPGQDWHFDE